MKIYAYYYNANHRNQCCFKQIYVVISLITFSSALLKTLHAHLLLHFRLSWKESLKKKRGAAIKCFHLILCNIRKWKGKMLLCTENRFEH